ncbi:biotin--[acetyl-CoA-carboxylase] ligase [Microlunatus antarcticus]|uniref:biotin--[biotin carboxyl-carrier protein] ligase n=1 Tax=Microlunatus antarcticus TaxID=53388 RepID=A0A7W5JT93_9ACTN|nr:BirA family biotin operon repressor/biotin-[acetyl-CoA-carboxylase] ligase [Microlunatus antarcticus]
MPDPRAADPLERHTLVAELVDTDSLWTSLDVVAETGSTNADLARAAREGAPVGSVLVADHQSAGRGRMGRTWTAPPGTSIAMSVLVRPEVAAERWTWLPLLAGLAVSDGIRQEADLPADLKWPNDVLVLGRKVSGVLAERVETPDGPAVVIGMGVNVHLTAEELPVPTATSLALVLAELGLGAFPLHRTSIISTTLRSLERILRRWEEVADVPGIGAEGLALAYRERCATLGREVRISLSDGTAVDGVARDVDASGRLVLETADGPRTFAVGDVVHLR